MRLGERLHARPWLSLAIAVAATIWAANAVTPLQYDFSFTSLFVGEGRDHDRLRDYLRRFGTDVNFVMIAVEADPLFDAAAMAELRTLEQRLEAIEGVAEVVSPTNVRDLVGDGGRLESRTVIPDPLPSTTAEWDAVRAVATSHPLLSGTVFSEDGRHASMLVRFGLESSPRDCDDGLDNDAGGDVDCADTACWREAASGVCERGTAEDGNAACTNGHDDDDDGREDCDDPDCREVRACAWWDSGESGRAACSNGLDDDRDGAIDCVDPDCQVDPRVPACDGTAAVVAIVDALSGGPERSGGPTYHLGGVPIVSAEYTRVIQHDMRTYLPMTGVLVGLVLVVLFRSVRGVVLPLLVVGVGIVWAMAAMMATGGKLNMINSSMPTLLLVIGIADAVHIVSRFLEESETSPSAREATRRTMRQMAGACLLTSVTSAVGFASLMSAHLPIIRSFGVYTAAGILLTYVLTMLVVPPALALLPLPGEGERKGAIAGERLATSLTAICVTLVTRRRTLGVTLVAAVLLPALWFATKVQADTHLMEELRPDNPVAVSNDVIERHHGGVLSGAIVFRGVPGTFSEPAVLDAMREIGAYAEAWRWEDGRPLVSRSLSLADVVAEAHAEYQGTEDARTIPATRAAVVSLLDQVPPEQREAVVAADYSVAHVTLRMYTVGSRAWAALRADLEAELARHGDALAGVEWYFTGSSTLGQDAMRFMTRDLLTSLGLALVIIMLLMSALFRSLRVGLLSMVPNIFPMLVTIGVVGYFGIDIRVSTAVVFSITLGIAVDDTIHLLVRFREELARPGALYQEALTRAMTQAGRPVVFTTVMLCAGFATLTLSEFTAVRELGILGGATLTSALMGDLLVLPLLLSWFEPKVG